MNEDESFAIQTELTIADMIKIAKLLEESVNRGAWKFSEIRDVMELHSKLSDLSKHFDNEKEK